jgi:predicted metal-dependent hydrolase
MIELEIFLQDIDDRNYFKAHEVLEETWRQMKVMDKKRSYIYKAFINAAVSFELYRRGRAAQSLKIWKIYEKYRPLIEEMDRESRERYKAVSFKIELHKERYLIY